MQSHHFMANRWGNNGNSERFIFLGSKITADGDCSHEIRKHLLLGRIVMTNLSSVQFSSFTQSCPTLCHPMNRSMPGLPVHHQLLKFTQTHAHRVCDIIQSPHPLSSPSSSRQHIKKQRHYFVNKGSSNQTYGFFLILFYF